MHNTTFGFSAAMEGSNTFRGRKIRREYGQLSILPHFGKLKTARYRLATSAITIVSFIGLLVTRMYSMPSFSERQETTLLSERIAK